MSNVVNFLQFKNKKQNKNMISCPYCLKFVDIAGWEIKNFVCLPASKEHLPLDRYLRALSTLTADTTPPDKEGA